MSTDYYIGLMSGTSMDAIDAVLVDFTNGTPTLIQTLSHPIPDELRSECHALCQPGDNEIDRMGKADSLLADEFADAALQLLSKTRITTDAITAIGSHGQTIRHRPVDNIPFTLQIGDANRIAEKTGITTVADFRRRDMAAGGQGAPLVPAFHAALLREAGHARVILNIGGIANITILPADPEVAVTGFDTGPGNVLMDIWVQKHTQEFFDENGQWAASGEVNKGLLNQLLSDEYFGLLPPKTTGRETFNLVWLEQQLSTYEKELTAEDIQATLCELTAISISLAIRNHCPDAEEVIVCGGGTRNGLLMQRLQAHLKPAEVKITDDFGLPADWVEATAFAWLARETLAHRPGNLPAVTGAHHPVILGGIYLAS